MLARVVIAVLALALSACSSMQLCPQRHAIVKQSAMSCAELNATTAAAVKRLGYNIDTFTPAANGQVGKLNGSRRDDYDATYSITVDLHCSTTEAVADAVSTVGCGGQIAFPNEFQDSFQTSMAKKIERPTLIKKEERTDLMIEVEPQRNGDKAVGVALSAANLMPVKVVIDNQTARVYRLDADSIALIAQDGKRIDAIPAADAAKRVVQAQPSQRATAESTLQAKSLQTGTIEPEAKREGYIYVPRQAYRRATVKLVDQEADEPEGFSVEF